MLLNRKILIKLFWCSVLLWIVAAYQRERLPPPSFVMEPLLQEPVQLPVDDAQTFRARARRHSYEIMPLFSYELYGMVVSRHHSDSWFDYHHEQWKDFLNVADLCVIYADNLRSNVYEKMRFSSTDYTCHFRWSSPGVGEFFNGKALSNNHVLTNKPSLIRKIKKVRPGDQIYMKGHLVNYHEQNCPECLRPSSISRDDEGQGACEVVFLEDFRILRTARPVWRLVYYLALGLTCLLLFFLLRIHEAIAWHVSRLRGASQALQEDDALPDDSSNYLQDQSPDDSSFPPDSGQDR